VSPRDEPIPLREAITAVGRDLGMPAPNALDVLAQRWSEIVGPALAPHARIRSIRSGTCTVEVDGPAWATQLRYLADDLARRCNECCAAPVVSTVRVVVARA